MDGIKTPKVETLESQKQELEDSMNSSRHQEYVRKEMDKIRAEGKMPENSVSDTHKIIKEAELRLEGRQVINDKYGVPTDEESGKQIRPYTKLEEQILRAGLKDGN